VCRQKPKVLKYAAGFSLWVTLFCMESCDFVNEEFPAEIQKFAKEQQVLNYAKYSNFLYKVLATGFIYLIFLIL
tara:strand:- start:2913 stop:3134 length:222 start_codon:yes stop_codon:yes gene_type:complete